MNRNFDASKMNTVHELKVLRLFLSNMGIDPLTCEMHERKLVRRMNRKASGFDFARLAVLEGR